MLELITRIRLPVGTGIYTRFPIKVVLRHSDQQQLSIQIHQGPTSKGDQQAVDTINTFYIVKDGSNIDIDITADIKEAAGIIRVPIDQRAQGNRGLQYSDDVLQITHHGPDLHDLTLIDLPGLFSRATAEQSKEDKKKVQDIVKCYIKDPNSIILLVCKGTNDYASNTAPNIISPNAERRTLGILTHLNLETDIEQVLKLHRGELESKFKEGWHFLSNKHDNGPNKHLSFKEQDGLEQETFKKKFTLLPADSWGVNQL